MPENSIVHIAVAGSEIAINPENGADLFQLVLTGKEVIKPRGLEKAENPWLFPFPNRLKNGAYNFEGKDYQFEINDNHGLQNALHGFVRNEVFNVTEQGENNTEAWVTLEYAYSGNLESYPFPFLMSINYLLSAQELKVSVKVVNTGDSNMPAGLGWHPYFDLPSGKDEAEIKLPPCQEIVVDTSMIPTGKKSPSTRFDNFNNLKDTDLDTCFELNDKMVRNEVGLKVADEYEIAIWQDEAHRFIQVFTHPLGNLIAIEPMTCGINAFNTREGLKVLTPGEEWEVSCGVKLV